MTGDHDLDRLEHQIGKVLNLGVTLSALTLGAGLTMWLLGIAAARTVLNAGLVLLLAIPITRVAASFVDSLRRRDRLLAWSTAIVLVVLGVLLIIVRHRG